MSLLIKIKISVKIHVLHLNCFKYDERIHTISLTVFFKTLFYKNIFFNKKKLFTLLFKSLPCLLYICVKNSFTITYVIPLPLYI